jgi:hypothetical protein
VPSDLTSRLEILERQHRRLRALCVLSLAAAPTLALLVPARADRPDVLVPPTVEARRFVVRDADGQPRAVLGLQGGRVILTLRRGDGSVALELGEDARPHPLR